MATKTPAAVPDDVVRQGEDGSERRANELLPFADWLRKAPQEQVIAWLQDALWKGQLQESELYRAFTIEHYKGIDMTPIPIGSEQAMARSLATTGLSLDNTLWWLGFSVRVVKLVKRLTDKEPTLYDLVSFTERDLVGNRNCNAAALQEIKGKLDELHLRLKDGNESA